MDPFFTDVWNGDYHLQNNSLCIGAGIDSIEIDGIWLYCPNTDCDCNPCPNPPGSMPDMGAFENSLDHPTAIKALNDLYPKKFKLFQNYPNPFNPITAISYQLSAISQVDLSIYNILGQKVATLVSEKQPAGIYKVEWDASGYSSGMYFYKLTTDQGFIQTRKLLLIK